MRADISLSDYLRSAIGKSASGNALRIIDLADDSSEFYSTAASQHVPFKDGVKDVFGLDTNDLLSIKVRTLS